MARCRSSSARACHSTSFLQPCSSAWVDGCTECVASGLLQGVPSCHITGHDGMFLVGAYCAWKAEAAGKLQLNPWAALPIALGRHALRGRLIGGGRYTAPWCSCLRR
jgi:hypothetical protein